MAAIPYWSSLVIICLAFLGNLLVSNNYLYGKFCQPSTIVVRVIFVGTFGFSASLLQLCLWEMSGSFHDEYFSFSLAFRSAQRNCYGR